jgi:hypothetical protein
MLLGRCKNLIRWNKHVGNIAFCNDLIIILILRNVVWGEGACFNYLKKRLKNDFNF